MPPPEHAGKLYARPVVASTPHQAQLNRFALRSLPACLEVDHNSRGPEGGVCAICGNAILTRKEQGGKPDKPDKPKVNPLVGTEAWIS
jgi:hypothetical protein